MDAHGLKFCPERGRLLDELHRAASEYAEAATKMSRKIGMLPQADYNRLRSEVEDARLTAQRMRESLFAHRKQHGC